MEKKSFNKRKEECVTFLHVKREKAYLLSLIRLFKHH